MPRLATPDHNLAVVYRHIAKEWHKGKNGTLTPCDVTPRSHLRVWWQCPKKKYHVYDATVSNRTAKNPTGCSFCNGKRTHPKDSLGQRYPALSVAPNSERPSEENAIVRAALAVALSPGSNGAPFAVRHILTQPCFL